MINAPGGLRLCCGVVKDRSSGVPTRSPKQHAFADVGRARLVSYLDFGGTTTKKYSNSQRAFTSIAFSHSCLYPHAAAIVRSRRFYLKLSLFPERNVPATRQPVNSHNRKHTQWLIAEGMTSLGVSLGKLLMMQANRNGRFCDNQFYVHQAPS